MKYFAVILLTISCATPNISITKQTSKQEPIEFNIESALSKLKVPQLFEVGHISMKNKNYEMAIMAFTAAINTGNLSDTGKAICYWYILESSVYSKTIDIDLNNVHSFITIY